MWKVFWCINAVGSECTSSIGELRKYIYRKWLLEAGVEWVGDGWILREEGEELRKTGREEEEQREIHTQETAHIEALRAWWVWDLQVILHMYRVEGGITKRGDEMKAWAGFWKALYTMPRCKTLILTPLSLFLFFFAQIISNITVLNFLQALGYLHTKEELLESELDVLKSLNFQINLPTPLAYVEMLLEVLGTLLSVSGKVGWSVP